MDVAARSKKRFSFWRRALSCCLSALEVGLAAAGCCVLEPERAKERQRKEVEALKKERERKRAS